MAKIILANIVSSSWVAFLDSSFAFEFGED